MKYIVSVQLDQLDKEGPRVMLERFIVDKFDDLTQAELLVGAVRNMGATALESVEDLSEQDLSEQDRIRQKRIIEAVNEWAELEEVPLLLLGVTDDTYIYADAIIGITRMPRPAVIYSREKVIEAMVRESDGGTWEEMEEFYEYNTVRGLQYMPEEDNPPILVDDAW